MLLCTKIRLQVSEADAVALEFMQGKCRGLYNWWVMRLRDGEQWPGWTNDWGRYRFVQMLEYECQHAGKRLERIEERYTSQDCSRCGQRQPMPLWKRTCRCGTCGLVLDRDQNSAVNILQRFLARLGPYTSPGGACGVLRGSAAINTF